MTAPGPPWKQEKAREAVAAAFQLSSPREMKRLAWTVAHKEASALVGAGASVSETASAFDLDEDGLRLSGASIRRRTCRGRRAGGATHSGGISPAVSSVTSAGDINFISVKVPSAGWTRWFSMGQPARPSWRARGGGGCLPPPWLHATSATTSDCRGWPAQGPAGEAVSGRRCGSGSPSDMASTPRVASVAGYRNPARSS